MNAGERVAAIVVVVVVGYVLLAWLGERSAWEDDCVQQGGRVETKFGPLPYEVETRCVGP